MRHNWNYKTIGDVCTSITDGSHNPPKGIDKSDYRMISSQNIFDDNLILTDDSVRYLSKENHIIEDKRTRLQKDVVLLTIVGTIGRACILTGNEGPLTLQRSVAALHPSEEILPRFLLHTLIGNRTTLNQEAHGIAQKGLYLKQLSALRIPVPTIEEQQKIVSELDKINELIRLKKEQLKDYDNLAQSIFYEMFGDPVVNEKGWDIESLGKVCDVRDGTHDSPQYLQESPYILITSKNLVNGKIDYSNVNYISKEDYIAINKRSQVDDGDIIMAMIGTIGNPIIVKLEEHKFCIKNVALIKFFNDSLVSNKYVHSLLNNESYLTFIKSQNKGGTQKFVALGTIRKLPIPIPPLSYQQQFAQRIELIEKQKAEVQRTIADLETLLASRMQYWFD